MADIDRAKRIIIDYTADELRFWAGIFRTIPLADDAAFVNVAILYRSAFDSFKEAHWPTTDYSGRYTPYYLDAWCDGSDIWTPDMRSFVYHGMARRFEAMAEQLTRLP